LAGQLAQQPQLQGVVIGVVVLFADQHPWRGGQALNQLLWGQGPAAGQFADHPKFSVIASLWRDRSRWWQYVSGLAGRQQADQAEQQKAHRDSLLKSYPSITAG
jgi:hypothetical protein